MTKEEQAFRNIQKGWGLISDGESELLNIWFKRQNLPERFRDYFALNSLAGGEFALDLARTPITDNWSITDKIETILEMNLSNSILSTTDEAYELAIEIMKFKGGL